MIQHHTAPLWASRTQSHHDGAGPITPTVDKIIIFTAKNYRNIQKDTKNVTCAFVVNGVMLTFTLFICLALMIDVGLAEDAKEILH